MIRTRRRDPYRNFKFRVKWDGRYVAGVSEVSGLEASTKPVERRGGAKRSAARKLPGLRKFGAVTLKRGLTNDAKFQTWATGATVEGSAQAVENSLKSLRRDIIIEVYNEASQLSLAYKVYQCWVSELQAIPDLDANAVAIESVTLENEGWERIDPPASKPGSDAPAASGYIAPSASDSD